MRIPAVLSIACFFAAMLCGQTSDAVRFVRATGEAVVMAKPDSAEISLGVVTSSSTAAAASTQNAVGTKKVLDSLTQVVGKSGTIRTSGYSLTPDYRYDPGHSPQVTGYRASNTLLVSVDDISIVGKLLDAATTAGGNNIEGISFTLRNDETVRVEALTQAAKRARANAEAIAKALGLDVIGVMQAEPREMPEVRPMVAARALAASAPTPIEPGTLEFRAAVSVTLGVR